MRFLYYLLVFTVVTLSFGQPKVNSEWAMTQPYVILVSIDGFRYDYAEKYDAKALLEIKKNGSSAKAMIPSFPSKTFPNHYTLVTGLYPANHGIVGNSFYSREKNETYRLSDKEKVLDSSWYGGMPIWSLAEEKGMLAASYFWVGSESRIAGFMPTYWKTYDANIPNQDRTAQVVDWLKLPEPTRPHLVTLYFSLVDDAGHGYGPDSKEVNEAVLEIDRIIGRFRKELADLNLPIFLILTADHGMAATNRVVALNDIDFKDAVVDVSSTMVMVYEEDQLELNRIKEALTRKSQLQVFTKAEMKERFKFDNDDRVGDLVGLANPPVQIVSKPKPIGGGTHGYDPDTVQEMHTIFMIEGPSIKSNYTIPAFRNIHVYPFLAHLLNLTTQDIDGELSVLQQIIDK